MSPTQSDPTEANSRQAEASETAETNSMYATVSRFWRVWMTDAKSGLRARRSRTSPAIRPSSTPAAPLPGCTTHCMIPTRPRHSPPSTASATALTASSPPAIAQMICWPAEVQLSHGNARPSAGWAARRTTRQRSWPSWPKATATTANTPTMLFPGTRSLRPRSCSLTMC